jgi:hypothetical protein
VLDNVEKRFETDVRGYTYIIAIAKLLYFSTDMLHSTCVINSAQADFLLQPSETLHFAHTISFRVSRDSQIVIISCEV